MRCAAIAILVGSALAGVVRADEGVAIHVSHVVGTRARGEIVAAVRRAPLAECQHTLMGGAVHVPITIEASGAVEVGQAYGNEEVRSYGRCVERRLAALRFDPAPSETRAAIAVVFPAHMR